VTVENIFMAARKPKTKADVRKKNTSKTVDAKLLRPVRGKGKITLSKARAIVKKVSKLQIKK